MAIHDCGWVTGMDCRAVLAMMEMARLANPVALAKSGVAQLIVLSQRDGVGGRARDVTAQNVFVRDHSLSS